VQVPEQQNDPGLHAAPLSRQLIGFSEPFLEEPDAPQLARMATTSTARRLLPNRLRFSRRIAPPSYMHRPGPHTPEQQSLAALQRMFVCAQLMPRQTPLTQL
jgi:hypothetical protein